MNGFAMNIQSITAWPRWLARAALACGLTMACLLTERAVADDAARKRSVDRDIPRFVNNEFVFPQQSQHVHCSSLVECPDGSLLVAWFQGSGEQKADDVQIMGARKLAGSQQWSEPFLLADTPGHPDCNPVLWIDGKDKLWLFWSAIWANDWGSSLIKYRVSTDYLQPDGPPQWEWQDVVHVKPADFPTEMLSRWDQLFGSVLFLPRAIEAELSATTLLALVRRKWKLILAVVLIVLTPLWVHLWRRRRTEHRSWKQLASCAAVCYSIMITAAAIGAIGYFAAISSTKFNQRIGWLTANKPIQLKNGDIVLPLYSDRFVASIMAISSDEGKSWEASQPIVGYGSIQPSLVQKSNGQLLALMRENGPRKRIRSSLSDDGGKSWSEVTDTSLRNPGAKVDIAVTNNGDWILAYNNLLKGRHSLGLAVSRDEGQTWQPFQQLEDSAPGEATYGYPCLLSTADQRIHVTYSYRDFGVHRSRSIKHATFKQPNGESPLSIFQRRDGPDKR